MLSLVLSFVVVSKQVTAAPPVLEKLTTLIQTGSREQLKGFVRGNFTPAALAQAPLDDQVSQIQYMQDHTRGITVREVKELKPNSWRAIAKTNLGKQWVQLTFATEPQAPNRLESLDFAFQMPPAEVRKGSRKLSDREVAREFESYMSDLSKADVFSGTVLLAKNSHVLVSKAYGEANKDFSVPNRTDTKFNLASANKMFTSIAIAQLVEKGRLSFDDTIDKFIPDFATPGAASKIRIRQLLTHSSGLGSYDPKDARHIARTVDAFLKMAKDDKLLFEPGTSQAYSNNGFIVLGKIIEVASGENFYDYIRSHITKPAGMVNSDYYDVDYVNKNLAVGYEKEYTDRGILFRNNISEVGFGGPAGGGFSTTPDMLKFSLALQGGKILRPDLVRTVTTAKPEIGSPTYGYGFNVSPGFAGHAGGDFGVNSGFEMLLDRGYTIIVLANYGNTSRRITMKVRELLQFP